MLWADSNNIEVREDGAYYKCEGKTYRDVYKNGLALDKAMTPLIADYAKPVKQVVVEETRNTNKIYDLYSDMECVYREKVKTEKPKGTKRYKKKMRVVKPVQKCVFEEDDVTTFDELEKAYAEEKWNLSIKLELMEYLRYENNRLYDRYDYNNSYDSDYW